MVVVLVPLDTAKGNASLVAADDREMTTVWVPESPELARVVTCNDVESEPAGMVTEGLNDA